MMAKKMKLKFGRWSQSAPIQRFAKDESGATSIEYGLIVGLVFLAVVASVKTFAGSTSAMYTEISDTLVTAKS